MVTANANTPYSSVSPIAVFPNGTKLYKLFSSKPLPDDLLMRMFHNHSKQSMHDWYAYPVFNPPEDFAPFKLAPGLYYGNAWENAASAMEMSAVSAANSALMVSKHLSKARVNI